MDEPNEITRRSTALTRGPLGCAFLLWIEASRLSVEASAIPTTSFFLLSRANADVDFWQVNYRAAISSLLSEGPRLLPLARDLVSLPSTAWWFESSARFDQLLARFPDGETRPRPPVGPARFPTEHERYGQLAAWGLYTSTERDGISSYLIAAQECSRDLGPLGFPHERFRMAPQPNPRVFVVRSPDDWRRLCLDFSAPAPGGLSGDLVVPDFGRASKNWDAVHMTLGGLLAADQVRIDGLRGTTALQGWDAEQTVWMRWMFDGVVRLPDLVEPVPSPLDRR